MDRGGVEVRAKVISGKVQGTHITFWMFPQVRSGGLARGEIDIAEICGIYGDRSIPYIHHPLSAADSSDTNNDCMISTISDGNTDVVEWTAQSMRTGASNLNEDYMVALTQGFGWPGNDVQPGITAAAGPSRS